MDVARTFYEKQNGIEESDNKVLPKEDTDKSTAKAEIPQENTADVTAINKTADEPDVIVDYYDDSFVTESTEMYNVLVTSYPIVEDLPVETAIDNNVDDYNANEVVLDPDNFEYFKGVSSRSSETNFLNRQEIQARPILLPLYFPRFCRRKAESRIVARIFVS